MPTASRSASERAEARRRSRQIARGEDVPETDVAQPATTPARPPGLFARMFPPAPPLAGKGDPLAGFAYRGRFRGLVAGAWLLVRHPLPWGVSAAGWAVLQFVLIQIGEAGGTGRATLITFAITLAQYGLLIAAGWIGWQRPWLFGAMAGLMGTVVLGLIAGLHAFASGDSFSVVAVAVGVSATYGAIYGFIGAFAGFYGGYLRRRMASQSATTAKGKRR
jgi:hypothetical protein